MSKVIAFIAGLLSGMVLLFILYIVLGFSESVTSPTGRALSARLESIPIESICGSIASGKEILGADHVTIWTDKKSYIVGGWTVQETGIPVFYWTGAGLPLDLAECKGAVGP